MIFNPDPKKKAYRIDRKTKKGKSEWEGLIVDLCKRDHYRCRICDKSVIAGGIDPHHIIHLSQGGSDEIDNLILLCRVCHIKVHTGQMECPKP